MHLLAFTLFWLTDTSGNDQGDDCKEVKGTKKDRKLVMVKKKIIKKKKKKRTSRVLAASLCNFNLHFVHYFRFNVFELI